MILFLLKKIFPSLVYVNSYYYFFNRMFFNQFDNIFLRMRSDLFGSSFAHKRFDLYQRISLLFSNFFYISGRALRIACVRGRPISQF